MRALVAGDCVETDAAARAGDVIAAGGDVQRAPRQRAERREGAAPAEDATPRAARRRTRRQRPPPHTAEDALGRWHTERRSRQQGDAGPRQGQPCEQGHERPRGDRVRSRCKLPARRQLDPDQPGRDHEHQQRHAHRRAAAPLRERIGTPRLAHAFRLVVRALHPLEHVVRRIAPISARWRASLKSCSRRVSPIPTRTTTGTSASNDEPSRAMARDEVHATARGGRTMTATRTATRSSAPATGCPAPPAASCRPLPPAPPRSRSAPPAPSPHTGRSPPSRSGSWDAPTRWPGPAPSAA